jgi:tryptophan synthase beta chain
VSLQHALVARREGGGKSLLPYLTGGLDAWPHLVQDEFGQVLEAESISAGLDYPGVGPEHAHLAASGRARYEPVTDDEVVAAFRLLSRTEGIIPALESAHAIAWVSRARGELAGRNVVINLSGRGDKDVGQMMEILGDDL